MDVDFVKYKFEDGCVGVFTRTKFKIGIRHVQMLYMFACTIVLGILRGSNGIAMLTLTDQTRQNDTYIQMHDWNIRVQGTVLSSFFWGYTLMLVPAELYLRKISGKFVLAAVLLANGSLYVALPTIANQGGWVAVCNAQFIMGMTQACLSPANQSLFSKWLPPCERNWFSCIVYSGIQLGIIISFPFTSMMASAPLGWELVFYSMAMMTLSATAIWVLLTAASPDEHPAVGDTEKDFIHEALGCYKKKHLQSPWYLILRSPSFWAITSAHVSSNAVFVFYITEVPAYLVLGLGIPLHQSGWFSMLPFISTWVMYATVLPFFDWFYKIGFINYLISITHFRKIINTMGASGVVLGLFLLSYLDQDSSILVVVLLCGIMSLIGLQYVGFLENYSDMSENFSGTLLLMSSVVSNVVGALVPFVSGLILSVDVTDLSRWRITFLTLASLCTACNLVYLVLGSAERQFWDNSDKRMKFSYYNDINQLELEDLKVKETVQDKNENDLI